MENGYDIRKASNVTTDIARSGFEDTAYQRLLSDTNLKKNNPGSVFEKRSMIGHSDPLKDLHRTASELYLQGLREYIAERKGTLGVGWNVEFKFCHKRCKTFAVYHGPDGSTFESMADVASHLGLPLGVHTIEMENGGSRFSLVHKESNNMLRRKNTSGPMQTRSCNQSSNAPGSSFLESGAFLQNIKVIDVQ